MGKIVCVNCKKRINRGSILRIGSPYIVCPDCDVINYDKKSKEFIMLTSHDINIITIQNILSSLFLGIFGFFIVSSLLIDTIKILRIIIAIITLIIVTLVGIAYTYNQYMESKKESLERTRDKKYLDALLADGIINEQIYKETKELNAEIKKQEKLNK